MTATTGDAPPLSWPQEVLRLAEQIRPGTVLDPRCTVHRAFAFPDRPDLNLVNRVLTEVVARHDAVRTVPLVDGDGLRLAPCPPRRVEIEVRPLTGAAGGNAGHAVTAAADAPHDLEAGPLLRATWLSDGSGGVLVLSLHHWAGDAGALEALTRELADLYAAFRHGRRLPQPPPQYADLARGQRAAKAACAPQSLEWWHAELAGARRGALPAAGPQRAGTTVLASRRMQPGTHAALLRLATEHRASPYMVVLAALSSILDDGNASADAADLTVFALDAARSRRSRRMLGFLAEPVPLRLRIDRTAPLGAAVTVARDAVLGALRHRDVAFLRLLEAAPRLAVALLGGRRPATYVQYLSLSGIDLDGLRGRPLPTFEPAASGERHPAALPVDLDITVERCGEGHHAAALYDPGLWDHETVNEALDHLEWVVRQADADPALSLAALFGKGRT